MNIEAGEVSEGQVVEPQSLVAPKRRKRISRKDSDASSRGSIKAERRGSRKRRSTRKPKIETIISGGSNEDKDEEDGMFITGIDLDTLTANSDHIHVKPLDHFFIPDAEPLKEEEGEGEDNGLVELHFPVEMRVGKKKHRTPLTQTQLDIEKSLEGLPGGLNLNPVVAQKYFGGKARNQFFDRYKWIDRQMQITQLDKSQSTPNFYFDNEKKNPSDEINQYAFAPQRPAVALPPIPQDKDGESGSGSDSDNEDNDSDNVEELPDSSRLYQKTMVIHQLNPNSPLPGIGDNSGSPTLKKTVIPMGSDVVATGSESVGAGSSLGTIDALGSMYGSSRLLEDLGEHDNHRPNPSQNSPLHRFTRSNSGDLSLGSLTLQSETPNKNTNLKPLKVKSANSKGKKKHGGMTPCGKNNNPTNSFVLNTLAKPMTPRTAYLVGCSKEGVLPRPSLVLRKQLTKELSVQHQGMGDHMATILAASLKELPYIQSINLKDNNLTCDGLTAIFESITTIPNLLELDISENELGPNSSAALGEYLSNPQCPLVRLSLQHADVDDFECEKFIRAISHNKNMKELDLSHNKIGEAENLNSVMPDLVTGGEAIAELLENPDCKLESLDLSWNKIRLGGAEALAGSLATNQSLTHLDLSFNALGSAGMILGESLIENRSLKHLILKNNGIDTCACFTICQAIMENYSLVDVVLDGNPIGEMGAKSLMMVPLNVGSRVTVSAVGCNIGIRDNKCWFDSSYPCRKYVLKLGDPYDRAVAFALLNIVANHQTYIFNEVVYEPVLESKAKKGAPPVVRYGKGEPIELVQMISKEKELHFDDAQKKVVEGLRKLQKAASNSNYALKLFLSMDADGGGTLDSGELVDVLHEIGLEEMTLNDAEDIIKQFDVDGSNSIGIEEFETFLKQQNTHAEKRLKDVTEDLMMALKSDPGRRYVPPRTGQLKMEVVDGYVKKALYKAISDSDQKAIHNTAQSTNDIAQTIGFAVQNIKLRYGEAVHLFDIMYKENRNKVKCLSTILPSLADPSEVRRMLDRVTDDDKKELQQLKQALGYIIKPLLGQPDGFYMLDLTKDLDKVCLFRLMEMSSSMNRSRMLSPAVAGVPIGDTSQHGNWSCFRNELFNGKPCIIVPEFFSPFPRRGMLEFDFFSGSHPLPTDTVLSNKRFLKILQHSCLLLEEEIPEKIKQMGKLKAKCDKALKGDGQASYYKHSVQRATDVFIAQERFYDHLQHRGASFSKGLRQEEVKVNYMANVNLRKSQDSMSVQAALNAAKNIVKKQKDDSDHSDSDSDSDSHCHSHAPAELSPRPEAGARHASTLPFGKDSVVAAELENEVGKEHGSAAPSGGESGGTTVAAAPPKRRVRRVANANEIASAGMGLSDKGNRQNLYKFDPNDPDLLPTKNEKPEASGNGAPPGRITLGKLGKAASITIKLSALSSGPKKSVINGSQLLEGLDESESDSTANSAALSRVGTPNTRVESAADTSRSHVSRNIGTSPAGIVVGTPLPAAPGTRGAQGVGPPPNTGVSFTSGSEFGSPPSSATMQIVEGTCRMLASAVDGKPSSVEGKSHREGLRLRKLKEEKANNRRINFKKLLYSVLVQGHAKAAKVVEYIEDILCYAHITCRQLYVLIDCFPQGHIWKYCSEFYFFGSYRVELLVSLISRVIDIHNIKMVTSLLDPEELAALTCRVGNLCLFNPLQPEGHHVINLGRYKDDRMFAKIFLVLSVIEPGINWVNHGFRWSMDDADPWIPGWDCSAQWMTDVGMPPKGILKLSYVSGDGTKKDGFDTNISLRKALCYVTSCREAELIPDEVRTAKNSKAHDVLKSKEGEGDEDQITVPTGSLVVEKLPGVSFIESKIEMFRNYLGKNNVQAAMDALLSKSKGGGSAPKKEEKTTKKGKKN